MSEPILKLGIPAGSLQEATGRTVPQGRLQDHLRQPQLLPGDRRPGDLTAR